MRCKNTVDGTYRTVTWRVFYPQCPRLNMTCNPLAGAYVAAITVCQLRLW